MDFKNTKVKVNSIEQSRKVQERMFKLGFSCAEAGTRNTNAPHLYFENDMSMGNGTDKAFFEKCSNTEVKVEDILKGHKEKAPTHVVIWDEEDRDPHKFFTSEKEAKVFVKELSEKSQVKKDSIILVVIKSTQKVKVIRNVRLSNYKI